MPKKGFLQINGENLVRMLRYDSYKIIFHQGLIFKEKKELPIQTETSRTLDLSFKIRIKLVKFSYSSELTFFIFRFPQSSSCIWNEIKVNHLAEKDKWVFSLILITFLNIQLFHPSFHNIHYLYIIKFRLTKIKSSWVVFSIRFFICCSTLLRGEQLFVGKLLISHYTKKSPARKCQVNDCFLNKLKKPKVAFRFSTLKRNRKKNTKQSSVWYKRVKSQQFCNKHLPIFSSSRQWFIEKYFWKQWSV